uniref:NADH dehydrogenase subunit 4L n=1 Tax=Bombus pratorum TaxID=30194 RepID=A0A0S2LUI1_BOMPR|nr:NADH dehydrogenase subunit 4L [Bombus pratorum]DBA43958.1 TPA_asm: ND4L [Bombus pratorum]
MLEFVIFNLILLMLIILLNFNIYFLSFLIGLEHLISIILFYMILIDYNSWIYLIYLIYSVCEGVLGLSLLVSMNYEYGHQKINFLNMM